jgi:hypothetical protein
VTALWHGYAPRDPYHDAMDTAEARGAFNVRDWDEETYAERTDGKLTRATVTAELDGDIRGTAAVTWLMCYRADGTADFVGFVDIDGTLRGRQGGFVVESRGRFDGQVASGPWAIVEGSGRGELAGIAGSGVFDSTHEGANTYRLTYRSAT